MRKLFLFTLLLCTMVLVAQNELEQVTIYNCPNGGFVVYDLEGELIGFSETGHLDSVPAPMASFMASNGRKAIVGDASAIRKSLLQVNGEIKDSVGPLLGDIAFDQTDPYYNHTKVYKSQHCLTGCVATAIAQIMTYYQHPKQCKGTQSYQTETLHFTLTYDYDSYQPDWENILHTYTKGNYTAEQADAVAELMLACGIGVKMDYNIDGSGSTGINAEDALTAYFDYNKNTERVNKADYTDSKWYELLETEFKAGRPVYYDSQAQVGSGHAYVCDGYKILVGYEKYPYFHFNWGWGGDSNGWFMLNKLNPSTYDFSYNQSAIRNIIPNNKVDVQNIYTASENEGYIYDLQGRRVIHPQKSNLYVRNGVVFMQVK